MGLRFRKSVSLIPGVRLNFGKTGVSVSAGVPGFRKTIHSSGRVTTSYGIPGTGIYYVDTKNSSQRNTTRQPRQRSNNFETIDQPMEPVFNNYDSDNVSYIRDDNYIETEKQIDENTLISIHKSSDDEIDWTEVLTSDTPSDAGIIDSLWRYYHQMAPRILSGDIDAYLQLIYEVNPLDDLLEYAGTFEFGTDDPQKIVVEFIVNQKPLDTVKTSKNIRQYNLITQDYISSICIRIARDMFALLPVKSVVVNAVFNEMTVLSVNFDRLTMSKVKFGYIDPSDTIERFEHRMEFDQNHGFESVNRLDG